MAGADNHPYTVNVGLLSKSVDVTGAAEGDLWYNSAEGRVKEQLTGSSIGIVGPHGSHPLIYGVANAWYPLQIGGGSNRNITTTNDRAYAYPIHPGRKCTLTGLAARVVTAGTGNARMALYTSDVTTGLPATLVTDYGVQAVTASAAEVAWTVSSALQPVLHWLVFISQTSAAPVMVGFETFNPMVPWPIATPTFGAADWVNCLISDTGFGGVPPGTFGAPATAGYGPFIFCRITQ